MTEDEKFSLLYKKILSRSIFTDRQMEVLLDYLIKKDNDERISKDSYVYTFLKKKYNKGVYFRILRQSIRNINRVIFSVILLSYLEIISHDDITKLAQILLSSEYDNLDEIVDFIEKKIDSIVRRKIVM